MYEMKFQEVMKNYMQPEPVIGYWNNIYINQDVWNKFTPAQQHAVEQAVFNAARAAQEQVRTFNLRALASMQKDYGVKANKLSDEELAKFKAASAKVIDEIAAKDPLNKQVIEMLKAFQAEADNDIKKLCPPVSDLKW